MKQLVRIDLAFYESLNYRNCYKTAEYDCHLKKVRTRPQVWNTLIEWISLFMNHLHHRNCFKITYIIITRMRISKLLGKTVIFSWAVS